MHPAEYLFQQPHFIQGLASTYSEDHITGVPKSHAVRNETKNEPDAHLAKRNETETEMCEMLNSRNRNETQNNSNAHFAKSKRNTKQVRSPPFSLLAKRNETKPKWAKLI